MARSPAPSPSPNWSCLDIWAGCFSDISTVVETDNLQHPLQLPYSSFLFTDLSSSPSLWTGTDDHPQAPVHLSLVATPETLPIVSPSSFSVPGVSTQSTPISPSTSFCLSPLTLQPTHLPAIHTPVTYDQTSQNIGCWPRSSPAPDQEYSKPQDSHPEAVEPLVGGAQAIWLLNARSLWKHRAQIFDLVHDFQPACLAITETWLKPGHADLPMDVTPPGYTLLSKPREGSMGGGVGALVLSVLNPILLDSIPSFSSFEHCLFRCGPSPLTTIVLCVIYHPPHLHRDFLTQFPLFCEDLMSRHKCFILLGDFNFHVDDSTDSEAQTFLATLDALELSVFNSSPTHVWGHCLDLLISKNVPILDSKVTFFSWTDHALVEGLIPSWKPNLSSLAHPTTPISWSWQRSWRAFTPQSVEAWIASSALSPPNSRLTVEVQSQTLLTRWGKMADSICPLKRTRDRPTPHLFNAWYNDELGSLKRLGRKLERAWRKNYSPSKKITLSRHYDIYKAKITAAKKHYLSSQLQGPGQTSKALFKLVNDFTIASRTPPIPPSQKKCEEIADYFSAKIQKIRDTISAAASSPSSLANSSRPLGEAFIPAASSASSARPPFLDFGDVSPQSMMTVLARLGPSSSKLDPIPTPRLKQVLPPLIPELTMVINSSLQQGVVPSSWKLGTVTPLLKKVDLDPGEMKNLRPVTQLSLLARVSEAVVVSQVQTHCETNGVLHDLQSGFRPQRGTESALVDIRERLLHCQDLSHPAALVLLDLSAAFDTIDHETLLHRLSSIAGIGGTALAWFRSFLEARFQQIRLGRFVSTSRAVTCGVPQGSALSPLLFNIYMRPLADIVEASGLGCQMYADDTQLVVDLGRGSTQGAELVHCLERVRSWMSTNWLLLNEGKTEVLLSGSIHPAALALPWPTSFGPPPAPVSTARNLGVWFHQSGGAGAQVSRVARSAHHQLNKLMPLLPLLAPVHRATLCQSLVLSKVAYCNSFYTGATEGEWRRLQGIQNRATRMVWGLRRYDHVSAARRALGWLSIRDQVKIKGLVIMWRALYHQGPRYLQSRFSWQRSSRPQRPYLRGRVVVPKTRRARAGGKALSFLGPRWWNSLPVAIRLAPSLASFKKLVKAHLHQLDS